MSPKLYSALILITIAGAFVAIRAWPQHPGVVGMGGISIVALASGFAFVKVLREK
jgi:hypothetical protein